jgi:Cys-rich radical ribosomally synthesized peptide
MLTKVWEYAMLFTSYFQEVSKMLTYNADAYSAMLGYVEESQHFSAARCVSQCTGCTCSCRCSCSGGFVSDFEWEEL